MGQSKQSVDSFSAGLGRLADAVENLAEAELGTLAMEHLLGMFVESRQAIAELAGMESAHLEGIIARPRAGPDH